jgi:hypothetical protein
VNKNKLDGINTLNLIYLENLEFLDLDSNEMNKIDDDSFYNLKSLETLILSKNKLYLADNTHGLFNSLTSLKFLNLSSNLIEIIRMDTFSNLLKLEVVDLSNNKIHLIKENSFDGLINLRDLYINNNEPNMKIENSSFYKFESIKTMFIDRSILNYSFNKLVFIEMIKNKNLLHNKTILEWNFYQAFNLIDLNDTIYDCEVVIEFLKLNILYDLKSETDYDAYLSNCQVMNKKNVTNNSIKQDKLTINYLKIFIIVIGCFIFVLLIWILYSNFNIYVKIELFPSV